MGVDLTLLPFEKFRDFVLVDSILSMDRRSELWDLIHRIDAFDTISLSSAWSHSLIELDELDELDEGSEDGEEFSKYCSAEKLADVIGEFHKKEPDNPTPRNLAVCAYLKCLGDTKIALYWH